MRPAIVSIQSPHPSIHPTGRAGERKREKGDREIEVINMYSTLLH